MKSRFVPLPRLVMAAALTAFAAGLANAAPAKPPSGSRVVQPSILVANALSSPSPSAAEQILVPRGTIIVVKTEHGLNSYGQEAGAKVVYEVVQDAIVDGYLIAQGRDIAEGLVQNSQEGERDQPSDVSGPIDLPTRAEICLS